MNKIIRRIIMAQVPNISDPFFSDDEVMQAIKNSQYSKYADENEYKRPGAGNKYKQGMRGFFTRQMTNNDINPIIFYCEAYQFNHKNSPNTLIISWQYSSNYKINTKVDCITEFPDITALATINIFASGTQLNNGITVAGIFASLQDTINQIEADKLNIKKI